MMFRSLLLFVLTAGSHAFALGVKPGLASHERRVVRTSGVHMSLEVLPSTLSLSLGSNSDISTLFSIATFGPQPLWLLMILAPSRAITKTVMGSWLPIVAFSLVHCAIVIVAATQTDGTAPIVEFQQARSVRVMVFTGSNSGVRRYRIPLLRRPTKGVS